MGSAFHQLCPRYSGTLTPTAPTAIRLWETFTFFSTATVVMNSVATVYCNQLNRDCCVQSSGVFLASTGSSSRLNYLTHVNWWK